MIYTSEPMRAAWDWRQADRTVNLSRMRLSGSTAANAAAWAVIIGLIGAACAMVVIIGPFGLILLGLFTLFVCTSMNLREDAPTWGTDVFRARMTGYGSPEQRAAMLEERRADLSPLRFYSRCGIVLVVAGILGFAWQQFR